MDNIRYPIYPKKKVFDQMACKIGYLPIKCPICNRLFVNKIKSDNFREDCICLSCRSFNRQRQISSVMISSVLKKKPLFSSLKDFIRRDDLHVYYTESKGPVHDSLHRMKNYVCSEYFGEDYKSGTFVDGIMHQDLQSLSFEDNRFDVILSSEVFEHIPDTYKAFREVYRVLKPGGRHIFTVPFDAQSFTDVIKAIRDEDGNIQYLTEPEYHEDPIRPNGGVLVYQIFSLEMLIKLNKIGFVTKMHQLYNPFTGILGDNAIVFESIK
jgi:SAM-dependent methyltransferase